LAASPLHAELIEQAEDQEEDLKAWALDGLRAAMQALRQRFPQDAWALERYYGVTSDGDAVRLSVSAIAAQMQKTTSAVQQHLSRGRARLRQLIATELRRTVDSPAEQQAEAELLFAQMVKRWPDLGS
jgi:DNA-directed RNA polymerase specialized sigma24 family protein